MTRLRPQPKSGRNLGDEAVVSGAWFDRHVEPIEGSLSNLDAPRFVAGDTDYAAALRWARDRVAADKKAVADVVLISDLQQSGLASKADRRRAAVSGGRADQDRRCGPSGRKQSFHCEVSVRMPRESRRIGMCRSE